MQRILRWLSFNWKYFGKPPWDTGVSPPELIEFIKTHSPGRALDLGCGTGTNLLTLAQAGWKVVGVDFALRAVGEARQKLAQAELPGQVYLGDVARQEEVQGTFDLVLDIGCYHSLPQDSRLRYRENLERRLKKEGFFLMYAHMARDDPSAPVGLTEQEVRDFASRLKLISRQDSQDRWGRSAAWFQFQRS